MQKLCAAGLSYMLWHHIYRCHSLAGQNNGVCIEGPIMLSFYLPPGRQSCIFKEDMHTVYVIGVHTIIQEFLHCT